jgi:UDP-N-acetylmuramyl tripeptide synthase
VHARWSAILAAQLKRLEALQKTLADYAHNSTTDRRHLITAEQNAAGAASIRLFGGTPDRDRQR